MSSTGFLMRLEPPGVHRSAGKWPDKVTMVPWKCGKRLVWVATCLGSLVQSYRGLATSCAGAVATVERKLAKYTGLDYGHSFTLVSIATLGSYKPNSMVLSKTLATGCQRTGKVKSLAYFLQ